MNTTFLYHPLGQSNLVLINCENGREDAPFSALGGGGCGALPSILLEICSSAARRSFRTPRWTRLPPVAFPAAGPAARFFNHWISRPWSTSWEMPADLAIEDHSTSHATRARVRIWTKRSKTDVSDETVQPTSGIQKGNGATIELDDSDSDGD